MNAMITQLVVQSRTSDLVESFMATFDAPPSYYDKHCMLGSYYLTHLEIFGWAIFFDAEHVLSVFLDSGSRVSRASGKPTARYTGELPNGIQFSDTRATLLCKLGDPSASWPDERQADEWCFGEYRLIVTLLIDIFWFRWGRVS